MLRKFLAATADLLWFFEGEYLVLTPVGVYYIERVKIVKESGEDPIKFLSMWGQLFLSAFNGMLRKFLAATADLLWFFEGEYLVLTPVGVYYIERVKIVKESGEDPIKFLSMWGQLFLMDPIVPYSTNILFEKPGILLKCALDNNEDAGLKFWFDSCFPGIDKL